MPKKSFQKKKKYQLACKKQAREGRLNNHQGDYYSESSWKASSGASATMGSMHLAGAVKR